MKFCLDPGHGGSDPGAVGPTGLKEAQVNLAIALKVRDQLQDLEQQVVTTRENNTNPTLRRRVQLANDHQVDAFLSIHCNCGPEKTGVGFQPGGGYYADQTAHGYSVWTFVGDTLADRFATLLFQQIRSFLPDRYGRQALEDGDEDWEARFYVLRRTKMPAVLVECLFISNPEEEKLLGAEETQNRLADAMSEACVLFGEVLQTRT